MTLPSQIFIFFYITYILKYVSKFQKINPATRKIRYMDIVCFLYSVTKNLNISPKKGFIKMQII